MVITLDGPSGTGKSTLAKMLAKKLNFKFLNTGMIYRAITHYMLLQGIMPENYDEVLKKLNSINIEILFIDNNQNVIINDENCSAFVNSKEVQEYVSVYSQILEIRKCVLNVQRNYAKANSIVVEGRDIGSEVFPNADKKFYVICDIDVRAKRRYEDLIKSGQNISLNEVKKSLENRDLLDTTRKFSPLIKPENAIVVDTSNSTIEQSLNNMLSYIGI